MQKNTAIAGCSQIGKANIYIDLRSFYEIIEDITDVLSEVDSLYLAQEGAKILAKKVIYCGSGVFELSSNDESDSDAVCHRSFSELIEDITAVLAESDGDWLAEKASEILEKSVFNAGNGLFNVEY